MTRLLVTGGEGQLGRALARLSTDVLAVGRGTLDIVKDAIDLRGVDGLINAAAYNAVDRAEDEPEAAFAGNRDAPARLASACAAAGVPFVHVSTDYVFDGAKQAPYTEDDPVAPANAYGRSKAEGEARVLAAMPSAWVVRTSWVFGAERDNYVLATLARARSASRLRAVDDQLGCPTWVDDLARALLAVLGRAPGGLLHFSGDPPVTRAEWTREIVRGALPVDGVPSSAFPTRARRPSNSVLDCARADAMGLGERGWRRGLAAVL